MTRPPPRWCTGAPQNSPAVWARRAAPLAPHPSPAGGGWPSEARPGWGVNHFIIAGGVRSQRCLNKALSAATPPGRPPADHPPLSGEGWSLRQLVSIDSRGSLAALLLAGSMVAAHAQNAPDFYKGKQ